ncbi:uncharacterized protein NECHADRAFT_84598 [Fusarium vanettenii 77-13-4]|uniref:Uncharacterized protein n=1 Tax=Fusarium vanettenii (strain ATCC MYA-4622 / CBS 123669 / FGSC 9596 / NRRL 45880 / 77-13-4) TaxID=660122 RepID=C7YTI8_FUSV7|nr:uncharacterized protein NECHADRAFT_84598 [Fusarium vanettenii 77-13-4]EEU44627.1 hypothetical protein NECHADRAFT_84598 [Fusarium vanettenii 77-13-4]
MTMVATSTIMRVSTDMAITMDIMRHMAMDTMKAIVMGMGIMRLTVTDTTRVIVMVITKSIAMVIAKITAMGITKPCYILTEKSLCRDLYILAEKADHAAHLVQTSLCRQNSTCWNHIREAIYKLEYGLDLFDKYVDHTTLDKCFTRSEEAVVTKCYIHYAQSVIRLLKVTHESGRYLEGEVDRPILTAINSLRAADRAFVLDLGRRIESKESLKVIMRKQGAEDGTTGDSVQEAFNRFIFTPLITGEDFKNHPSEAEERARKVEHYGKGGRKHGGQGYGHGHGRHGYGHGHGHEHGKDIYRGYKKHGHDGGYTETLSQVRKGKDGYHHVHHHGHHHGQKGAHHHGHEGGHHGHHHGHKEGHGNKHGHSQGHQEGHNQGHGEGHGHNHGYKVHHHGKHHANPHQKRNLLLLMMGARMRPVKKPKPLTPRQELEIIRQHRLHHDKRGHEDENIDYFFDDELDADDGDDDASRIPKSEHNGRLHDNYQHPETPYRHHEGYEYGDRTFG